MVRTYEDLLRVADAYADSRILATAVELDVFTHIGHGSNTASRLAKITQSSHEGMEFLLNALVGMGLLQKKRNRFRNVPLGRTYLDGSQEKSVTHFLWLSGQHGKDWVGLTEAIRKGRSSGRGKEQDDPEFRKRFAKALHERSFYITPKITRPIRLGKAKTLLDLGGGAGSYAFALLRKTPGLHATIFDRPAAVQVARKEARKEGLAKRVRVIGGDLFADSYRGPYDVIFYSNVIHIYGPRENQAILRKIKKAMNPGGKLLIVEYFLDQDQAHPPEVSSFALMMYLFTESGRCYTWEEVTRWLKALDFSRFRRKKATAKIGILEATLGTKGNGT